MAADPQVFDSLPIRRRDLGFRGVVTGAFNESDFFGLERFGNRDGVRFLEGTGTQG